jgi:hypothetical protein
MVMTAVKHRTCEADGCETVLPDDYERTLCPLHVALLEELLRQDAMRCEASGPDWACDGVGQTARYGRLCMAHYQQVLRGIPLRAVRRRTPASQQFEVWAAQMREGGWTCIPPGEEE